MPAETRDASGCVGISAMSSLEGVLAWLHDTCPKLRDTRFDTQHTGTYADLRILPDQKFETDV
jgi:hypothetical protein